MTRCKKNRSIWFPLVLLIGVGLLFAAGAPARAAFIPLKVHNGALDPQNDEGWGVHHIDAPGSTQSWGPVYDDNGTGVDAWYVYDTSSEGSTLYRYRQVPTAAQVDYLKATNWTLKTIMRVPDDAYAPSPGAGTVFRDGSKTWSMQFGLVDGDMAVDIPGGRYTLTGLGNADYHEFALQYDRATEMAQLYVDGVARLSPTAGTATTWTDFYFGSNSSGAQGMGHYNHVSLVPEPGTLALLGMAGLALLCVPSRRQRVRVS